MIDLSNEDYQNGIYYLKTTIASYFLEKQIEPAMGITMISQCLAEFLRGFDYDEEDVRGLANLMIGYLKGNDEEEETK